MKPSNEIFRIEDSSLIKQAIEAEFRRELNVDVNENVRLDSKFFDLGVTSLGLQSIKQNLEKTLNRPIDSEDFFNFPTIGKLSKYLSKAPGSDNIANPSAADTDYTIALNHLANDLIEEMYK